MCQVKSKSEGIYFSTHKEFSLVMKAFSIHVQDNVKTSFDHQVFVNIFLNQMIWLYESMSQNIGHCFMSEILSRMCWSCHMNFKHAFGFLIYVFCVCEGRYAELPKEVKNSISHRYRALAALSEHFSQLNDAPETKRTKHQDWVQLRMRVSQSELTVAHQHQEICVNGLKYTLCSWTFK